MKFFLLENRDEMLHRSVYLIFSLFDHIRWFLHWVIHYPVHSVSARQNINKELESRLPKVMQQITYHQHRSQFRWRSVLCQYRRQSSFNSVRCDECIWTAAQLSLSLWSWLTLSVFFSLSLSSLYISLPTLSLSLSLYLYFYLCLCLSLELIKLSLSLCISLSLSLFADWFYK